VVGRAVRVGLFLLVVGALALLFGNLFGCSARSSYCATWSLAGPVGALLFLVGLVVTAVSFRRRRPSVEEWARARAWADEASPGPDPSQDPRGPQ
jgi:hypothetical protein